MDYFYASDFVNGYAPGLSDTQIGVGYKVSSSVSMGLNYHYFATGVKLESLNRTLGSELDYQVGLENHERCQPFGGLLADERNFDNGCRERRKSQKAWQDWGWVSLNVNPTLFKK